MDRACAMIVPVAFLADARKLWCAMGFDTLPGATFASELSATGLVPVTHYGAGTWESGDIANLWSALPTNGGTVPDLNKEGDPIVWEDFGLTLTSAKASAASMVIGVTTGGSLGGNYAAALAGEGLKRVEYPDDF